MAVGRGFFDSPGGALTLLVGADGWVGATAPQADTAEDVAGLRWVGVTEVQRALDRLGADVPDRVRERMVQHFEVRPGALGDQA